MPRKIIASPKNDSVGSLLSHARDPFQAEKWEANELARQREQYAEELKAQIYEKEAAKAREKASSPRFAAEAAIPASPPMALLADDNDVRVNTAMDIPLTRAPPPIITIRPAVESALLESYSPKSAPPVSSHQTHMTEKERFIASMEHGITRTPTHVHRSVTLPANNMSIARAAEQEKQEESAEALRRQQSFKADLEIQIQEKKRLKALELEKERQWALEEEARLEKEREELRKEFEAEHAARKAKVEADAAENAAAMASRKATASANLAKESNDDVKIYAPKRRNITNKPSSVPERSTDTPEQPPTQQPQWAQGGGSEENSSTSSTALDPKELSKKLQEMESKFNLDDQPISRRLNSKTTLNLDAAHTAALTEQVEELKRLNEALQRDLSLHKTVLELVKDNKLASMQPPPPPPHLPIYVNPLALGLQTSVLQPVQAATMAPTNASFIRHLPIVYTASELRTEDSRPPTRMMAVPANPKPKPAATTKSAVKDTSENGMLKAVRPGHQRPRVPSSSLSPGIAVAPPAIETAEVARQKVSIPEAVVNAPALLPLETARLPAAKAAERLGIWKKAKLKLRKLSVSRATGAKEATWVMSSS